MNDEITVNLYSKGRFSVPESITVRNFTVAETLILSGMSDQKISDQYLSIIKVMQAVITTPEVNAGLLTDAEVLEIALSIIGTFWTKTIKVPVDNDEVISAEISSIESHNVDFTEPIRIENERTKQIASFRIPRLLDFRNAHLAIEKNKNISISYELIKSLFLLEDGESLDTIGGEMFMFASNYIRNYMQKYGPTSVKKNDGSRHKINKTEFRLESFVAEFDAVSENSRINILP